MKSAALIAAAPESGKAWMRLKYALHESVRLTYLRSIVVMRASAHQATAARCQF
jgi:hypothetical protein